MAKRILELKSDVTLLLRIILSSLDIQQVFKNVHSSLKVDFTEIRVLKKELKVIEFNQDNWLPQASRVWRRPRLPSFFSSPSCVSRLATRGATSLSSWLLLIRASRAESRARLWRLGKFSSFSAIILLLTVVKVANTDRRSSLSSNLR